MGHGHTSAESSDRDGQRVLLVEDHSDIRRVLRVSLEAEGYSVVEASNGPEGIDRVDATHPDLVILDLMLPVEDGWWFLREVQQCPALGRWSSFCRRERERESASWRRTSGPRPSWSSPSSPTRS